MRGVAQQAWHCAAIVGKLEEEEEEEVEEVHVSYSCCERRDSSDLALGKNRPLI